MSKFDSKTYILDDQWTDKDALDFTPYVETLADIIIQTGSIPLTIRGSAYGPRVFMQIRDMSF